MITIQDNFIENSHYDELISLWIEFNMVHWIGAKTAPKNPLAQLVHRTYPRDSGVTGATAWYNIRPINPQWHNDIDSYCTQNKILYYPKRNPDYTHLYYIHSPKSGGELELETGDLLIPKINRMVGFPCKWHHRIRPYKGNRVSIGIIWWYDLPKIYGNLGSFDTTSIERVWEKEDKLNSIK